ncbi:DUF1833 family protein [Flexibacterium corallicola]|uniref:DUF1833 family protein n=1 Tax=Flexibacterium corallicola TaxID=3037259 RepID=UPI00286F0FA7|nr:DUF1833 family protein [Pseudovibrio sp. M1P-2-3]
MTDLMTEAMEEAYASTTSAVIWSTVELTHSSFIQDGEVVPLRFVSEGIGRTFKLEDDAPYNSGQEVEFMAVPFGFELPDIVEGSMPTFQVWIDNAVHEVAPYLEAAKDMREPIFLNYREFLEGLEGPQHNLMGLEIKTIQIKADRVTATSQLYNWQNRGFPHKTYRPEEFPTLAL